MKIIAIILIILFRSNATDGAPQKKSVLGRLIVFWAAIASLAFAIVMLTVSIFFSTKYSNDQVSSWLMNYGKAILIDLILCPIAGFIMTFVFLKYTPTGKFNFLEHFLDYNLCLLLRTLKWVPLLEVLIQSLQNIY